MNANDFDKSFNPFSESIPEENFFVQNSEQNFFSTNNFAQGKRLNDYDLNILKDEAYRNIKDELLKLEYKISMIENELSEIDSQILVAKDIRDFEKIEFLYNRKRILQKDYQEFLNMYNETRITARISGGITNVVSSQIKEKITSLKKMMNLITQSVVSKLPGNMSSIFELKESLRRLKSINKNVDELMTMQIPYGENGEKYSQLSKYITKANSIQSDINKLIK